MHKIKEELALKEAQKQAEAKKRGTYPIYKTLCSLTLVKIQKKNDDARARAAVKAQIEADKKSYSRRSSRHRSNDPSRCTKACSCCIEYSRTGFQRYSTTDSHVDWWCTIDDDLGKRCS